MKTVIALSGGLDSAVLLAHSIKSGYDVQTAVGFDYGSKHGKYEREAARELANHYAVSYHVYDIRGLMQNNKSVLLQGQGEIPEGHYEEESMRQTVVPGRNLLFISIMAGLAEASGIPNIMVGCHAGDHFIYPDCRPSFVAAAKSAVFNSSDGKVTLATPFLHNDKAGIVALGHKLGVPFAKTRTCYKAQAIACGKCGSCQERLSSFAKNKLTDPLQYESTELFPKMGVK